MALAAVSRVAVALIALLVAAEGGRLNKGLRMRSSRPLSACGVIGGPSGEGNASLAVDGASADCAWRWQVAFTSDEDPAQKPFCGGMLIHKEWVLTAEKCARHANFSILAGDHNKGQDARQSRKAMSVFPHPQHAAKEKTFDFALIRLNSPMEIGDCVGTVCLPTEGADVEPGTKCMITGWGTLRKSGGQSLLQEAEVTTMSNEDCGGHDSSIEESMLCAHGSGAAGEAAADACQGDTGGPLVCEDGDRWIAYGAASWGHSCAGEKESLPGVWARIHEAVEWIDETMEINGS